MEFNPFEKITAFGLTAKQAGLRITEDRWSKINLLQSQKQPTEFASDRKPSTLSVGLFCVGEEFGECI